jgi:hypothetical protein
MPPDTPPPDAQSACDAAELHLHFGVVRSQGADAFIQLDPSLTSEQAPPWMELVKHRIERLNQEFAASPERGNHRLWKRLQQINWVMHEMQLKLEVLLLLPSNPPVRSTDPSQPCDIAKLVLKAGKVEKDANGQPIRIALDPSLQEQPPQWLQRFEETIAEINTNLRECRHVRPGDAPPASENWRKLDLLLRFLSQQRMQLSMTQDQSTSS